MARRLAPASPARLKVLLAHPGTQHAPRLAAELGRLGALAGFWTGVGATEGTASAAILRLLGRLPPLRGLGTRVVTGLPSKHLHTLPGPELRALWRMKRGGDGEQVFHTRNAEFQAAVPSRALMAADAVIGFDTSGWILAERAQLLGKPFILDRSIAHPAALPPLLARLSRLYPEWADGPAERPAALVTAEEQEHQRAARIVVGGSFARDTLLAAGLPAERIIVNPYGVAWDELAAPAGAAPLGARPLRFLFVGSVTARKGVPVLLDAWRRAALPDAELWIAGSCAERPRALVSRAPGVRLLGQIPRAQIPALYAQCDVFVLPSLFEGFGLVILEALAAGLPVIATPHTGAVEAVRDPALGQLVPVLDAEALAASLKFFHRSPPSRAVVQAAAAPLRGEFSWRAYGDRWAALLRDLG